MQRLSQNLSAIFNWCLDGYLILMQTRDFTTMEDEKIAKQEFKEASNPLISFLKDTEPQGRISKDDLYLRYQNWCLEAGHKQGSRTYFVREIKKLLPEGTEILDSYYAGKRFRGYVFPGRSWVNEDKSWVNEDKSWVDYSKNEEPWVGDVEKMM